MDESPHALDWDALPFSAISAVVQQASRLPRQQAASLLAALRLLSHHWRCAVDDSMEDWHAPLGSPPQHLAAVLSRWRHLRRLTLEQCELDGATLEALSSCRRLEELVLCYASAPENLFQVLSHLSALSKVVYQPPDGLPAGASVAPLAACTLLRALDLHSIWRGHHDLAADVVAVLHAASGLQHLGLSRSVRSAASQAQQAFDIGFATQLTSLELRASFTVDDAFEQLFGALSNLQRLDISANRNLTDDGFRSVTRLAGTLTELVLEGGHEVSEDGATALALLTRLQSLCLGFSNKMSGDALLPLIAGSLRQLTHLDIRGCRRACSPTAFSHLTQLKRLQRLTAPGCQLQQAGVDALAMMPSLRQLDVADNPGLLSLDPLSSLRELRLLDVAECELQDAHVVPALVTLPQLRTVLLSGNRQLTAAVVEALAAGPARTCLQELAAADLQLDCESLVQLLPQLTALEQLDVSGNDGRLDPEAMLAAAEAAPSLHTVSLHGVRLTSAAAWHRMMQERSDPGRRRLLRIEPWDSASFAAVDHV